MYSSTKIDGPEVDAGAPSKRGLVTSYSGIRRNPLGKPLTAP